MSETPPPETRPGRRGRGLGRGLDALFGELETPVPIKNSGGTTSGGTGAPGAGEVPMVPGGAGAGVRRVPIEQLRPGSQQPRRRFDDGAIEALAQSIYQLGMLQPILVRALPQGADLSGARWEIVAGERRWRAAQRAALPEVPVVVQQLSDREALEIGLVENLQRLDLTAIEEAQGYRTLIERYKYTHERLSLSVGKSRSHITNTLRLLDLPEQVRTLVQDGSLSAGHARALVTTPNPERLAHKVVTEKLNVRETERLAREASGGDVTEGAPRKRAKDPDTRALEDRLTQALGLKVDITTNPKTGAGKLTITWRQVEQLDEVLRRLDAR